MAKKSTDKIGIDLKGRINRLKLAERNMLHPLFEAVVNSIHAIEDLGINNGEIKIYLKRTSQSTLKLDERNTIPEIVSFTIEDNGIGFNEENYESFKREYSTYKAERGGLGIGRFMWLKAFSNVKIESIFYDNGNAFKRNFNFNTNTPDGIENSILERVKGNIEAGTKVHLLDYKEPYVLKCPKKPDTIANRIIEHCLIYFLDDKCPSILLIDGAQTIDLNNHFKDLVTGYKYKEKFSIQDYEFSVTLLKWFEHEELTFHKVSLCANNREVENFNINKVFPDVSGKIRDETSGRDYLIVGYVEGEYLNHQTNDERTEVHFSRDGLFDNELIKKESLYSSLAPIIKQHFQEEIAKFKEEKLHRVQGYIEESAPQYRILNKHHESFDEITVPENISNQELDLKLYKLLQGIEFKSRAKAIEALESDDEDDKEVLKEKYATIFEELSDINKSKLAQYVVYRKYILDLFEKSLSLNAEGKYELEDTVHSIIYPTHQTSNEIDYNHQNLWIIDERLSFHTYLSSDNALSTIEGFEKGNLDRPDLMIFNNPISYIEGDDIPFNSVVLVEFKRPMRKAYNEIDENPIVQIYDYVRGIREGNKLKLNGRPYDINESTRFYCYVICDINDKIIRFAENAQLEKTYDGQGFYGYNKPLRCLIDIMPFSQVLSNAKKRNKVLFHKLGI